jgi:hypothetical protein
LIACSYEGKDSSKFETDSVVYGGGGEQEFLREDCSTGLTTILWIGILGRFLRPARAKDQV